MHLGGETSVISHSGHRIAVVDDDPIVIQAEQDLLEEEGHDVRTADTIEGAVKLVREFRPDLLLLDYMMPGGTGADVVRAIRRFDQLTQVILVSSVSGQKPVRNLLAELDIQGFHYKSDGPFRLLLQVDAVLKHARVLRHLDRQQTYLRHILDVSPELAKLQPLEDLFATALRHLHQLVVGAAQRCAEPAAEPCHGFTIFGHTADTFRVYSGAGRFGGVREFEQLPVEVSELALDAMSKKQLAVSHGFLTMPLFTQFEQSGCVVLQCPVLPAHAVAPCRLYIGQLQQALENVLLYDRATRDALTGLYNRGYGQQQLQEALHQATLTEDDTAVILLDVDHFKKLNDTYGHAAGDIALRRIAQAMNAACRVDDVVARYGGEEFLVTLPRTSLVEAMGVAERILQLIRELRVSFTDRRLAASAGVAVAASGELDVDELLKRADTALYHSKTSGRDQVTGPPAFTVGADMTSLSCELRRQTGS